MVQVYLPMGYPLQSGQQFANVIYQGNVVRLYTVPKDPRTEGQLDQRRFLSDITKMRSMLGAFGKAAMNTALGSKWGTVIYQAIKADMENWWSDAVAEWDNFTEGNKNAWRETAPYKACFNDLGLIYFGLTRVMYWTVANWSSHHWELQEWGEAQSAGAAAWWSRDFTGVWVKGVYDSVVVKSALLPDWVIEYAAGHYSGSIIVGNMPVEFYFKGINFVWSCFKDIHGTNCKIYIDGVLKNSFTQYSGFDSYNVHELAEADRRGLHYVSLWVEAGTANIDYLGIG